MQPNGHRPPLHLHPHQQQRVEVLGGRLGVQIGRRDRIIGAGDRLTIPPGVRHRFWNAGDQTAQLIVETTPALRLESLVETLFALAAEGRTNARGLPPPLHLAALLSAHSDCVRLARLPVPLVQLAVVLAARLGRPVGHRPAS